jgi:hypothetical protein
MSRRLRLGTRAVDDGKRGVFVQRIRELLNDGGLAGQRRSLQEAETVLVFVSCREKIERCDLRRICDDGERFTMRTKR